jgi:hypothetical protein
MKFGLVSFPTVLWYAMLFPNRLMISFGWAVPMVCSFTVVME